jgi:hypothetical protein
MAATPHRAVVWLRVELRELLNLFDPRDRQRTLTWLELGQWEALSRLRAGGELAAEARSGPARVEWSARSVLVLPRLLCPGPARPCAAPMCKCVAPGHDCGLSGTRRYPKGTTL